MKFNSWRRSKISSWECGIHQLAPTNPILVTTVLINAPCLWSFGLGCTPLDTALYFCVVEAGLTDVASRCISCGSSTAGAALSLDELLPVLCRWRLPQGENMPRKPSFYRSNWFIGVIGDTCNLVPNRNLNTQHKQPKVLHFSDHMTSCYLYSLHSN